MQLRDFFSVDAIDLNLTTETKDETLKQLVGLFHLDEKSEGILFKMLKRRENLGSTGIGRGIAIPHCRSLVVNRLRVAFGRHGAGLDFKAIDEKPVHYVFLIVAPPLKVSAKRHIQPTIRIIDRLQHAALNRAKLDLHVGSGFEGARRSASVPVCQRAHFNTRVLTGYLFGHGINKRQH